MRPLNSCAPSNPSQKQAGVAAYPATTPSGKSGESRLSEGDRALFPADEVATRFQGVQPTGTAPFISE